MFTSSIKRRFRFHVVVVQWTSRKNSKKCDTPTELLFCSQNLFLTLLSSSSLPSFLKLPNVTGTQKGRVKEIFFLAVVDARFAD